jgi:ketopantoate reductase
MRILVIGAGVLGSLYAGRLAAAGNDVGLLARGSGLAELQREPLRLVNDADGTSIVPRLTVVENLKRAMDHTNADALTKAFSVMPAERIRSLLPQVDIERVHLIDTAGKSCDLVA